MASPHILHTFCVFNLGMGMLQEKIKAMKFLTTLEQIMIDRISRGVQQI